MAPKISIITSVYKGEDYFTSYFKSLIEQTIFNGSELILISNEPSIKEKELIEKFKYENPEKVKTIFINPKETLSASWNRGIQIAKGDFMAFWNVDDIRTPESLENQINTLENNPEIIMTYGDFIEIRKTDNRKGVQFLTPEFKKEIFLKRFASGGAFLVFRSDIFNKCGYFDEQLEIASDYDFVLRLVNLNQNILKTPGIMGYFLNNETGLSTKTHNKKVEIEQNIIYRRYGNLDKLKWEFIDNEEMKHFSHYLFYENYIPIDQYGFYCGEIRFLSLNQIFLFFGKNIFRSLLQKIGLWDYFLKTRDNFMNYKKEINEGPK